MSILLSRRQSATPSTLKVEPLVERKAAVLVLDIHKPAGPWYNESDGYSYGVQSNICWFLGKVRELNLPVFLFAYQPNSPFGTEDYRRPIDPKIVEAAGREARILVKTSHDAFKSSKIDSILRELGVTDLVVIGMNKFQCVLETIEGGQKAGYRSLTSDRLMYGAACYLSEVFSVNLFYAFRTRCHVTITSLLKELESMIDQSPK